MGGRYRSTPVIIDGLRFASKIEGRRYGELRLLQKAGEIRNLQPHPSFAVEIAGQHYCTYTADFSYVVKGKLPDIVIEEVKSKATRKDPAYRLRRKAAELFHGIKVREIVR